MADSGNADRPPDGVNGVVSGPGKLCLVLRALNGSLRPGVPNNRTVRTRPHSGHCKLARLAEFGRKSMLPLTTQKVP